MPANDRWARLDIPATGTLGLSPIRSLLNRRRRTFLGGALTAFATRSFGDTLAVSETGDGDGRRELLARPSTEPLVGMPYPPTSVWAFDGRVPGPEIRLPDRAALRRVIDAGRHVVQWLANTSTLPSSSKLTTS